MKLSHLSFTIGASLTIAGSITLASAAAQVKGSNRRSLEEDGGGSDINVEDFLGIGCFSGHSTVQVQDRPEPVSMNDLQVGDYVLTSSNDYAPIYAFGHRHESKEASFLKIATETKAGGLEMTPEHLVFLQGKSNPVRADSIQEGDMLRGEKEGVKVSHVDHVVRNGMYAPFTTKGTIVVDGIVASTYVALQEGDKEHVKLHNGWNILSHHTYMHLGLAPFRLACLGVSSHFCRHDDKEEGMPAYVSFAKQFDRDIHCQTILVQAMVMIGLVAFMAVLMAVELAVGPSLAPGIALAVGALYFAIRTMNVRLSASY